MTTIANIAQRILDENGYTTGQCSTTILEYLIDNAIDDINNECGTSIADLTGSAGSKSLVATEDQILAVKLLSSLYLRARQSKGPNINVSPLSRTTTTQDPHYQFLLKRYERALGNLKEPPIYVENDPLPNE